MRYSLPYFLLISILLWPTTLFASSCMISPTIRSFVFADAVFMGEVTNVNFLPPHHVALMGKLMTTSSYGPERGCGDKLVVLKVKKTWKGKLPEEVLLYDEDQCSELGHSFTTGMQYLIFSHYYSGKNKKHLFPVFCSTADLARRSRINMEILDKLTSGSSLPSKIGAEYAKEKQLQHKAHKMYELSETAANNKRSQLGLLRYLSDDEMLVRITAEEKLRDVGCTITPETRQLLKDKKIKVSTNLLECISSKTKRLKSF